MFCKIALDAQELIQISFQSRDMEFLYMKVEEFEKRVEDFATTLPEHDLNRPEMEYIREGTRHLKTGIKLDMGRSTHPSTTYLEYLTLASNAYWKAFDAHVASRQSGN